VEKSQIAPLRAGIHKEKGKQKNHEKKQEK